MNRNSITVEWLGKKYEIRKVDDACIDIFIDGNWCGHFFISKTVQHLADIFRKAQHVKYSSETGTYSEYPPIDVTV